MDIKEQYLLKNHTTMRIGGAADFFVSVSSRDELVEAVKFAKEKNLPMLVLGGGSNMLVSDVGFRGLVIEIALKGVDYIENGSGQVFAKIGAGEVWDDFVAACVLRELWGVENLSNIPGLTGGVPVQNVGAYGQEASQVIEEVEVYDLESDDISILKNADCGFGYRSSNFNTIWKNKFAILSVSFRLLRNGKPNLNYADVKKYFENAQLSEPTITQIRQAIIEIRKNKFPDLTKLGCAGSFFKNSILTPEQYLELEAKIKANFSSEILAKLQELKARFIQEGRIKISSAFLIDICQLKGKTMGEARLWDRQPLVIVNMGNAKASDVVELFNEVKKVVLEKTSIELAAEPEFIGF